MAENKWANCSYNNPSYIGVIISTQVITGSGGTSPPCGTSTGERRLLALLGIASIYNLALWESRSRRTFPRFSTEGKGFGGKKNPWSPGIPGVQGPSLGIFPGDHTEVEVNIGNGWKVDPDWRMYFLLKNGDYSSQLC